MTNNMYKVLEIVKKANCPFYLECNDFLSAGLPFEEELDDLLSQNNIAKHDLDLMLAERCIWSARFTSYAYTHVVYAADMDLVIDYILVKLREVYCED